MTVAAVFFYVAEAPTNKSVPSLPVSLYWSTITTVTVGYGVSPKR
jgi:hypothetical protein